MAIQKKVLTSGGRGVLALGKPGDIASRAYGPVVRPYKLTEAKNFGDWISAAGGILVNSDDCAGLSTDVSAPFDTKGLKADQVGSVLVSGACYMTKTQYQVVLNSTGTAKMKINATYSGDQVVYVEGKDTSDNVTVYYVNPAWTEFTVWAANTSYKKGDYISNTDIGTTTYYKASVDFTSGDSFSATNLTTLSGTPANFDDCKPYAADSLVKVSLKIDGTTADHVFANPEAYDGIVEVEVNGLA